MSQIINYQPSYYDRLLAFYKRNWEEENNKEYLDYRLFKAPIHSSDVEKNLLAINDDDDVVGCFLFLPAKATICGEEHTIYWGHDMLIEKDYRGDLGAELFIKSGKLKPIFSQGLSPISQKINKRIKTNFIAQTTGYYIFNWWSVKILLYKLGVTPKTTDLKVIPNKIKVKGDVFELVKHAEDVSIPDDGYWNKGELDIELNRGIDFLKHRFFEHFNKYYFYQKKNSDKKSYFVFRKIVTKNIPTIRIVDFRYDQDDFGEYLKIIRAVNKVAIKNRIPLVSTRSTISDRKIRFCPPVLRSETKSDVTINLRDIESPSILVTLADSDMDMYILRKNDV